MSGSSNSSGGSDLGSAPHGESGAPRNGRGGVIRMWITGILFLAAGVVTFIAGDENRWISIPAAVIAAIALVDFLSVGQRRRRANSE